MAEEKPYRRGRGGYLWFGYGCRRPGPDGCLSERSYAEKAYRLVNGPGSRSSYRNPGFEPGDTHLFEDVHYRDNAATPNRGWLRVEYTGTKSSVKVPYAFKSKAVSLGAWSMLNQAGHSVAFSQLGVAANRIGRITTTIRSDLESGNGFLYSNLYRANASSSGFEFGSSPEEGKGGGLTYIDEERGIIAFKHGTTTQTWAPSFYYNGGYDGTDNRGHVLVDYLAGSCEQGPDGYRIQAVPGTRAGDCNGTSQQFTVEGAGQGTLNGTTTDDLAYVYKQITANGTNRTLTVKVVSQDAANTNDFGLAGVMIRASLAPNSAYASMVATRSSTGRVYFRRRQYDNDQDGKNNKTQVSQATDPNIKSPCWVRVQKAGNTFRAYYHSSTSDFMPSTGWVKLGPDQTIAMGSSYYIGLMVSNFTDSRLSKVQFRGLTESSP